MKVLKSDLDLDLFFRDVSSSPQRVLFLDYDGTLAPFKVNRDGAEPYPGVRPLLQTILKNGNTRLVMISGRIIEDIIPLLKLDPLPEIWGSHGWERLRPDKGYEVGEMDDLSCHALDAVRTSLEDEGLAHLREDKPGCLALHWRGLDESEVEELREKYSRKWSNLSRSYDLTLIEFDGGLELRIKGQSKAYAVRTTLAEMGEETITAFLGDDMTDEEAFRELGRNAIGVLVRSAYRPTSADVWIKPPEELLEFLARWVDASEPGPDMDSNAIDTRSRPEGGGCLETS